MTINIYKTFHTMAEHILFSNAHRTFTKINHILDYKTCLNIFTRIKLINFSHDSGIKLEKKSIRELYLENPKYLEIK